MIHRHGIALDGIAFALLTLAAGAAHAVTEAELLAVASGLDADYDALAADVDGCPGGTCSEAQDLVDRHDALEVERAQLEADRDTLTGCGCVELDALIDDIRDTSAAIAVVIGEWEEGMPLAARAERPQAEPGRGAGRLAEPACLRPTCHETE